MGTGGEMMEGGLPILMMEHQDEPIGGGLRAGCGGGSERSTSRLK